jgi:hypothetical protein
MATSSASSFNRSEARRLGTGLLLAGAAPFVFARLEFSPDTEPRSRFFSWRCPIRALTGIPCPGCGATRAFIDASHTGQVSFDKGNATWPVMALAASSVGAALVCAPADSAEQLSQEIIQRVSRYSSLSARSDGSEPRPSVVTPGGGRLGSRRTMRAQRRHSSVLLMIHPNGDGG